MLKYIFANIRFLFYLLFSLFVLLFLFFVGFNIYFFIVLIVWVLFYFIFIRKLFIVMLAESVISILFIALIGLSLIFFFVGLSGKSNVTNTANGVKLTKEQCAPLFQEYDGKVLKLMGEGLIGSLSIRINPEDCKFEGRYLILVNTSLPANYDTKNNMPYPYNYIATMRDEGVTTRLSSDSIGMLSSVYKNKGVLADAFGDSSSISEFYRIANDPGISLTDWFYNSHTISRYMSKEQYERLLKPQVFSIVDGLPFIEAEQLEGGGVSTAMNHARTSVEGNIVKSITISVSE